MSGHMKKLPTDEIRVTFTGPISMVGQALEAMRSLGFEEAEKEAGDQRSKDSIPWQESVHFDEIHAGSYLSGARFREGLTQAALSERTGIPRRHISEMENGKRPIGKANARKLSKALNLDPRVLLSV